MKRRLLSGLLAVIMLVTFLPISALAAEADEGGPAETFWTVTAFDGLEADTAAQTAAQLTEGVAAYDPYLPETLGATVEGQPVSIDVGWTDAGYDQRVPGVYVYTALLPDEYMPAEGVSLPTVTVTVEAAPAPAGAASKVVTGFEGLEAATATQTLPQLTEGAAAQDPYLPGTLRARLEGAAEPASIENVLWRAEPAYDQRTAGDYIYTAELPEGYTLTEGVSLPTITVTVEAAAAAPTVRTVTGWEWDDPDELLTEGGLGVPGASAEDPALLADIIASLPGAVRATVEGEGEPLTLAVRWSCPEYPTEGAYEGEYTFTAALPEGYELQAGVSALNVTVQLGGAGLYAAEQFSLATGGTYWFDLSGQSIPGSVNTGTAGTGYSSFFTIKSVPDATLTWVPFTYAGTVNAYVLNSDSSGVVGSSAQAAAAIAPDAYGYLYDHSLFIADYAVTNKVKWMELKDAGFIFGKAYSSGGVEYALRAPSMGSSDEPSITPAANEWDEIRSKGVEIKNYGDMNSIGQDTMAGDVDHRVVSGPDAPSDRSSMSLEESYIYIGYRPVLEVPADLVGSSLNVVTLNLGGGHLTTAEQYDGAAVTQMNIVYAGDSYAAPSGSALTAPEGSTGTYFYWKDSKGRMFAPGDTVPGEVTSLTAVWEKNPMDTSWFDESKSEFTITTAAQLAGLARICEADENDKRLDKKTVLLDADIDLDGYDWEPIWWGYGTFDGQGHAITNMRVTEGLIRTLYSGDPDNMFGGLFAYAGSTAKLCGFTVSGSVVVDRDAVPGYLYAGGVVGYNGSATIINVGSNVDVTASGNFCYAGGIAGLTYRVGATSCILNSYANGAISTDGSDCYPGGIAGCSMGDSIINCYYDGSGISATGATDPHATGITRINGDAVTAHCYSNFTGGTGSTADFHGEAFADGGSLLAKLNDPTVREQILNGHKAWPMAWVMGAEGMPVLSTSTQVPVTEQFDLSPGGTYWFDLSGVSIPGTANPNLSDATLHYVPFTYAGTVNAYGLKAASSGVVGSSTTAAGSTDPDGQYGYRYDHSLFIADEAITESSSWDELHNAELIFGKAHVSNGVDYTLRAPSAGASEGTTDPAATIDPVGGGALTGDPSTFYAKPITNEWDSIRAKGVNISPEYNSWGQDTASQEGFRAYRINCVSDPYTRLSKDSKLASNGYLPVLEVDSALTGSDLKAVTLNLGGATVGGSGTVYIIVKNGEGFTAPVVQGLTAPTDTHFTAWTGSDGSTYAAGDPVPAEVTGLTAVWAAGTIVGDFVVAGGTLGSDYEYDRLTGGGCVQILSDKALTISMKPGVVRTENTIFVRNAVRANITLAGVNISADYTPLDFSIAGESTLTLAEDTENMLATDGDCAGVHIGAAKLTIDGDGALNAWGGSYWPGIGGTGDTTLVIDGGEINASGGIGAAGIGGGARKNAGSITINDGRIVAYGGIAFNEVGSGTGIGAGYKAVVNNDMITINGGYIYAEAGTTDASYTQGGNAGIGGGEGGGYGNSGCTIVINGGEITATGSSDAYGAGAGIGACGNSSAAKSITITGGVITATAGANGAAGIGGGGCAGSLRSLSITGGFIVATGTKRLDGSGTANAIGSGADFLYVLSGVTDAVIIDGATKTGRVYGDATLIERATVPAGVTLSIPEDASLTVSTNGVLTNRGLIKVDGALAEGGGSISGDGEIQYAVAWGLTGISHDKGTGVTYASNRSGYSATLSASRGFELPALITVKIGGEPPIYGYAFNKDNGALIIYALTVNSRVEITGSATLNKYSVSYGAGQHGSITGSTEADYVTAYSDTLVPATGYALPMAITMTMGGADFTEFSYDSAAGDIDIEANKILGNIVISGACTPISYNISYTGMTSAVYGAKHPATHIYDTDTEISDPTRTGYTFAGWKVNGGGATKGLTLAGDGYTADITLEATWTANTDTTYTVEHYVMGTDGAYPTAATASEDKAGTSDAELTLADLKDTTLEVANGIAYSYGQVGGSTVETSSVAPDGSRIIKLYYARSSYELSVEKGTGITSVTGGGSYRYGQSVTLGAAVATGYSWEKWTSDSVLLGDSTVKAYTFDMPAGAVTLTASATLNKYSVSYGAGQHGSITGSTGADYVTAYSDTLVPATGYALPMAITMTMGGADFAEFSYDSAAGDIDIEANKILGNIVISGACRPISYHINYTGMGSAVYGAKHPATHTYDTATEISDPTRTGYTFAGWKVNGGGATKGLILAGDGYTADITLEATWTANTDTTYTVEHYVMGTDGAYPTAATASEEKSGTSDAALTLADLEDATLEVANGIAYSYGQVGGSTVETSSVAPDGSRIIKLYYARSSYELSVEKGTGITSVTGGGSYRYGQSVTLGATVATGYSWEKWTSGSALLPDSTVKAYTFDMPAGAVTLTASATLNKYSVSYGAGQHGSITGSTGADYVTAYSDTLVPATGYALPMAITMTMGGADFTEFSYDSAAGDIDIEANKILGNIVISGACTPISYHINYTGMGSAVYGAKHPATHTYDTATEISDPTRTGYTFAGWKVNGGTATKGLTLAGDGYTADITLEATWTANTDTVTMDWQGATLPGPATVTATYDSAMPGISPLPQRKYTVTYDYKGADGGNASPSADADHTLLGCFDAVSGGTRYYAADGTSARSWDKTQAATLYARWTPASVTLPTPSRTGYTFGGWYGEEACTSLVGAGGADYTPTAAVTLYAKWTIKTYPVTLPTAQTGYTLAAKAGSRSPVDHGGDYTFVFTLAEDYSASTPVIRVNDTPVTLTNGEFTLSNITEAQTVTVEGVERNGFAITQAQLGGAPAAEIDGVRYSFTNGVLSLPDGTSKIATVITEANAGDPDPHKVYPTAMRVYILHYDPSTGNYTPEHLEAFDDLLRYAGCSIRLTGSYGIRMITGMDELGRKALINGDGDWKLMETGTVVAWAETNDAPTVGGTGCASNHAYKRGGADPIFKRSDGLIQYTNVLVNDFTRDQCVKDFAMRPYAKLQNADGQEITVYGGVVQRSIWYVAKQNEGRYSGTFGAFIDRIIAMQ